jgi:ATP adenylyltransferase
MPDLTSAPGGRPLWAPWRMQYILGPKDGACFLCHKGQTGQDDAANHVIARGREVYVLLNDFPYNPGHLLLAPYRHVDDLDGLTTGERGELLELLVQAERVLKAVMNPQGFNMGCNLGEVAGAGVKDHVHWHLVPRWGGDTNYMPVIGDVRCVPEALDATCRLLRDAWS